MVRSLQHHEQKLLKKVDFLSWKHDAGLREIRVLRRYHIQNRDDYHKYNTLCGSIRAFAHKVSLLPAQDPFRTRMEGQILSKLYDIGALNSSAKLSDIENKLTVAAFCRRRLAVIMCMSKMAETVSAVCLLFKFFFVNAPQHASSRLQNSSNRAMSALVLIQSQILLFSLPGQHTGSLPTQSNKNNLFFCFCFPPPRHMEDFVTWVDTSKLKRTVMQYNDEVI